MNEDDCKTKTPSAPARRRMKAFDESRPAPARQAGLILLCDGEVDCSCDGHRPPLQQPRRAQSYRYPDFGRDLAPAFPPASGISRAVALGVRSPLQWRNRPRFSRGSLSFDCVSDGHPSIGFKEQCVLRPSGPKRKHFYLPGQNCL